MKVTRVQLRKACHPQLEAWFQMIPEEGDWKPLALPQAPSSPCVSIRTPIPHCWMPPSPLAPGHLLCFAVHGTVSCPALGWPSGLILMGHRLGVTSSELGKVQDAQVRMLSPRPGGGFSCPLLSPGRVVPGCRSNKRLFERLAAARRPPL